MPEKEKINSYLASLRMERWPRSLAIIPGVAAVYVFNPSLLKVGFLPENLIRFFLAFLLTWFISTANYIVNEITDAPYDAFHPLKKDRPLVKNEISRGILIAGWWILVVSSGCLSYVFYHSRFILSLFALLAAGIFYNIPPLRLKDIPYVDAMVESANNPIRFLIGWYILEIGAPPLSLVLSWWAFGNFLMVGKRVAEKKFLSEEESSGYRLSLKRYSLSGLTVFMVLSAVLVVVTFVMFCWLTDLKKLLYSLPFIVIYLLIFMKKSLQDRETAEEPEKLLQNPYFALYTLFLLALFIVTILIK